MKPNQFNQHGSRSKKINPMTGRRYDYETEQLAKHAEENRRAEEQRAVEAELQLLERTQVAKEAVHDLLTYTRFTMPDPANPSDPRATTYNAQPFHKEVAKAMEAVERGDIQRMIFCMPPRHGKCVANQQVILTPDGWRTHGDLQPGDYVFGPDGKPTKVLAVSPEVAEVVPVYLSNGDVIETHLNHDWKVYDRVNKTWRVMETHEIKARKMWHGEKGKRGCHFTFKLPDAGAVEFPEANLTMHPYALGAWLGNGKSDCGLIASDAGDGIVAETIEGLGYSMTRRYTQENTGVLYCRFGVDGGSSRMMDELRALDMVNNKHVPEAYLRASIEQRLQLLAGFIDTDGHVEKKTGRVRYSTTSEAIRDGVYDLATGLGMRPYITKADAAVSSSGIHGRKDVYQVCFMPNMKIPTRVPRKAITRIAPRRLISITDIGPVTFKRARSICVDREDGLYVVGKTCVVTKNTELATKRFTAWLSGRHPEWNIAVGTYADDLAEDIGADVRNIMATPQHRQVFPTHGLQKGGTSKSNMLTLQNGRLVFVGRKTGLTGKGAHILLVDDILKNHEEARSQTIRDESWNWFTKVGLTRLMGPKLVLVTMTRWHSDDLVGRLTDPENPHYNAIEAAKWKIIRLPAIAEDDDPLGREPGEPLWPEAFDADFLASQQRIDPLGFAALYQQTPTVADGTLFRRETIQRYEPNLIPDGLRYYATSDHALGTKQRNDPSCFLKGGVDNQGNLWLTEMFWQRVPSDRAVDMMLEMGAGADNATRPLIWWAERGHISKSIGPFLQKRMLETGRYLNVQEVTPIGDKEQRAQSIAARVALGKVYFPKGALWDKAIEEPMAFPNGLHDDFVDALSLFGLGLTSQFGKAERVEKKEPRFGAWAWVKAEDAARSKAVNMRNGGF